MIIKIEHLTFETLPQFVYAYKNFHDQTEVVEMTQTYFENWYKYVMNTIKDSNVMTLLAVVDNCVVGFLVGSPIICYDEKKSIMIDPLWVNVNYRKQNVAQRLIKEGEKWIKEHKVERIFTMEALDGVRLWSRKKSLGFEPYRTILIKEV